MLKRIILLLGGVVVFCCLFFVNCQPSQKNWVAVEAKSWGTSGSSQPEQAVRNIFSAIEKGDPKGAEQFMTENAKNFRFPMGSEKWADEIADLIDRGWRIEGSEISGSTARVKVAVKYRDEYYSYDENKLKVLEKERIWTFILEKENGKWLFDRLPEYY